MVRTRLREENTQAKGFFGTLKSLYHEGGTRQLYRGLSVQVSGEEGVHNGVAADLSNECYEVDSVIKDYEIHGFVHRKCLLSSYNFRATKRLQLLN